jgi:hypothetical protein
MIERGGGTLLFGLAVGASRPFPPLANVGTAAAAARTSTAGETASRSPSAPRPGGAPGLAFAHCPRLGGHDER